MNDVEDCPLTVLCGALYEITVSFMENPKFAHSLRPVRTAPGLSTLVTTTPPLALPPPPPPQSSTAPRPL